MTPPANLEWIYPVTGWVLAAVGFLVLATAIARDRGRGTRRCPRCWYAMAGLPGLRCPECGTEARAEKHLWRSRRRWRRTFAGLGIMLAGYGPWCVPRIAANGWSGAVPTTALIVASPWLVARTNVATPDFYNGPPKQVVPRLLHELLYQRTVADAMWDWQWRLLIELALRSDHEAILNWPQTGSGFSAVLHAANGAGKLSDPSLAVRAASIASVTISARSTWPAGLPIYARIRSARWNEEHDTRVTLRSPTPDINPIVHVQEQTWLGCGLGRALMPWDDGLRPLPALPPGLELCRFTAAIEQGSITDAVWKPICSKEASLTLRFVPSVADVVHPIQSETLATALQGSLRPILARHRDSTSPAHLHMSPDVKTLADAGSPTLAVRIRVQHHGTTVYEGEAWWGVQVFPWNGTSQPFLSPHGGAVPLRVAETVGDAFERDETGWQVVLDSDPVLALRNFDSDTYWSGTLTLPLSHYSR